MITYTDEKSKLQNSVALLKFGIFAMLIACILTTIGYCYVVKKASKHYYSAEAKVTHISGPSIDTYKNMTKYKYTYYCEFTDHEGKEKTGHFTKTNSEDAWEYPRDHVLTIYYPEDFADEKRIYSYRPEKLICTQNSGHIFTN